MIVHAAVHVPISTTTSLVTANDAVDTASPLSAHDGEDFTFWLCHLYSSLSGCSQVIFLWRIKLSWQCDVVAGELDTKRTMSIPRPGTTASITDRKQRERSHKTQAKHRGRTAARTGQLDMSLRGGLLSRPWKRLFGVSTDVSLPCWRHLRNWHLNVDC